MLVLNAFASSLTGFPVVQDGSLVTAKLLINAEAPLKKGVKGPAEHAEVMFHVLGNLSHLAGSDWTGV